MTIGTLIESTLLAQFQHITGDDPKQRKVFENNPHSEEMGNCESPGCNEGENWSGIRARIFRPDEAAAGSSPV